jgi:adenylylsulfate kinase-like enzyme
MARDSLDYETARRQQEQTDRARAAYVTHFHPDEGAWEDPRHYDLTLDSTRISLETCTEIIIAAARDLFAGAAG